MGRANSQKPVPPSATEQLRLAKVERWLARGFRPTNVMHRIRKEWAVSETTAWNYIAKVRDRWAADAAQVADRAAAHEEISAQARELLKVAWMKRRYSEVRRVLVLLADLKGLRLRTTDLRKAGEDTEETIEAIEREMNELLGPVANTHEVPDGHD